MKNISITQVDYQGKNYPSAKFKEKSVEVIGLDTEALSDGRCFMIATSIGDVFTLDDFPEIMFTKKYRGKTYVVYNLKYDEGALLQNLTETELIILREKGKVQVGEYKYYLIPRKELRISRGKNGIRIYDMFNFFATSLNEASKTFLGKEKKDIETLEFSKEYVKDNWNTISEYCIKDAELVKELAEELIHKFESFGVYPRKLYSTAYVSYQYFKTKCHYPTVYRMWQYHKELLGYAMRSYNGGKFEVTKKGSGYFYEYDIDSAYPFQIANLIDITGAKVRSSKKYIKDSAYAFIDSVVKIPFDIHSPLAIKRGSVNAYPCGEIRKVITKEEYDYLISKGVDIKIIKGWYIIPNNITYPFRKEILKLYEKKKEAKELGKDLDYHIIKIFLNSLYGKFVQLIKKGDKYVASSNWNPIYGSVITSNVRIIISNAQDIFSDIQAVHTDSVITKNPIDGIIKETMGGFLKQCEGEGVILGSGIYQIGKKVKFRGFSSKLNLMEMIQGAKKKITIKIKRPLTWKEIIFHGWSISKINNFTEQEKNFNVNFDTKRIWLNDYKKFSEALEREVESIPFYNDSLFGF